MIVSSRGNTPSVKDKLVIFANGGPKVLYKFDAFIAYSSCPRHYFLDSKYDYEFFVDQ